MPAEEGKKTVFFHHKQVQKSLTDIAIAMGYHSVVPHKK